MKELEMFRLEQIQHLELEQEIRAEKLRNLKLEMAGLEAAQGLGVHKILRAKNPLPTGLDCPRCWISTGDAIPLKPVGSSTSVDILRCHECETDFEIIP